MSGFHRLHELRMRNDQVGYDIDELRPRFERLAERHKNGAAPRAVSAYQLFQTPPELTERLVALAGRPVRCLEPSAGLGRLLDHLACEVVAVEQCPTLCSELYRQERERVRILQRDFLTVTTEEIGLFDAVVMNPPFHLRSDIAHIEHALTFVRPGGRLVALCLDTPHRENALRDRSANWEKIPAGAFKSAGTMVATVLVVLDKP